MFCIGSQPNKSRKNIIQLRGCYFDCFMSTVYWRTPRVSQREDMRQVACGMVSEQCGKIQS